MKSIVLRRLVLSVFFAAVVAGCGSGTDGTDSLLATNTGAAGTDATDEKDTNATGVAADDIPNPLTPTLSGNIPLFVAGLPKKTIKPEQARPFFDTFSWQSFIALNWPTNSTVPRGTPINPDDQGTFRDPPQPSTTVWESYKDAFDLFGTGDARPTKWEESNVINSPCADVPAGSKMLVMPGKGSSVLSDANEAFSFPLIDQNRNYVWAEIRFDEAQYDIIRGKNGKENKETWLYLKKNLIKKDPLVMPSSFPAADGKPGQLGSIMVKASWRIMTEKDDKARYYTVTAQIYDPGTKTCQPQEVGLVGFHIAHKVEPFTEWVWSSFEQVDNVRRGHGATDTTPISFNNGTDTPATPNGWANRPDKKVPPLVPVKDRTPAQITRHNAIPKSTVDVNVAYQTLLKGTVWQYYELVITQWPTKPESFVLKAKGGIYPQDCGQPFPINGCTNTALESFLQSPTDAAGAGGNSCMQCHYGAASSDFSWALQNRSH